MRVPNNRDARNERNRLMSQGVLQHLTAPIGFEGASHTPAETAAILTDPAAKSAVTIAAEGAFHQAVASEQASAKVAGITYLAVKAIVLNQFKGQPAVLADFGVTEHVRKVPTAAQKAAAAAKRKVRRDAKKAALAAANQAVAPVATPVAPAAPPAAPVVTNKS